MRVKIILKNQLKWSTEHSTHGFKNKMMTRLNSGTSSARKSFHPQNVVLKC